MNDENIKNQELIERYLMHQLGAEELDDFTFRMMSDEKFRKDVEASRLILKTTETVRREGQGSVGKKGGFRYWILGLLAVLGLGIIWILNQNQAGQIEQVDETVIEEISTSETSNSNSILTDSADVKNQSEIPALDVPKQPEKSKPTLPKTSEKNVKPRPIAAGFEPNPIIETRMGTQFRSNEYEFNITSPESDSELKLSGQNIDLNFKGNLKTEANIEDAFFQLHLFSNKEENFKKFRTIRSWDLEFKSVENQYEFSVSESIELEEGLYYFLIRDEDMGHIFEIGRLKIIKKLF